MIAVSFATKDGTQYQAVTCGDEVRIYSKQNGFWAWIATGVFQRGQLLVNPDVPKPVYETVLKTACPSNQIVSH